MRMSPLSLHILTNLPYCTFVGVDASHCLGLPVGNDYTRDEKTQVSVAMAIRGPRLQHCFGGSSRLGDASEWSLIIGFYGTN